MRFLDLTPGFDPTGSLGEARIPYRLTTFPGGEPHFKLEETGIQHVTITHRINSFNDLGVLAMAVDAIKRQFPVNGIVSSLSLILPYFPGGRQDRVCNEGEAFSLKVYADMINAMGFVQVIVLDPHSDVTTAVLDNCTVMNNHDFIRAVDTDLQLDDLYIVSPDAGANKKVVDLCKACGFEALVKCDKERDISTGKLKAFTAYTEDLEGRPCLIVDDICDGGGTFIGLAEKLKEKNAGDIYLAVSHGIFSKGTDELAKYVKGIYTTDSIRSEYDSNLIKVINLNQL